MARPQKEGLDYFPFDVDLFEDDKLFDIQNEYGCLGEVIYLRLLCLIYKNGYYYKFESIDKLAAMMIKSIGNKWIGNKQTVTQVIRALVEVDLFAKSLFPSNVITSEGIQRRYLKACERRQLMNNRKYWLLNDNPTVVSVDKQAINVDSNAINVDSNAINVDSKYIKEKESKVKEIRVGVGTPAHEGEVFNPPTLDEVQAYCREKNLNVDAQNFIQYYEATDWIDSKGQKVISWKGKAISWNNRESIKIQSKSISEIKSPSRCYTSEEINAAFDKLKPEDI